MWSKLKLTFFRQHEQLEVNFKPGINAIRGVNEAGKSTVLEAIAYACFGVSVLEESLDGVVTYDHKSTELKVEAWFKLNTVEYYLKRSEAGAELTFGPERITGQRDVTEFMERLLGATRKTAGYLMMAKQSKVTGALDAGPQAAMALVESLASFHLIDQIVGLIQQELPSGSTTMLETQVRDLSIVVEKPIEDHTAELTRDAAILKDEAEKAGNLAEAARRIVPDEVEVNQEYQSLWNLHKQRKNAVIDLEKIDAELAQPSPDAGDAELIAELTRQQADANKTIRALALKQELEACVLWEAEPGSVEVFRQALRANEENRRQLELQLTELKLEHNTVVNTIIRTGNCKICGKDFTTLPEVQNGNAVLIARQHNLEDQISRLQTSLTDTIKALANASVKSAQLNILLAVLKRAEEYVEIDTSVTPPKFKWIGPTQLLSSVDFDNTIRIENNKMIAYHKWQGNQDALKAQKAMLVARISSMREVTDFDLKNAEMVVDQARIIKQKYNEKQVKANEAMLAYDLAKGELSREQALVSERRAQKAVMQGLLEKAKENLALTIFHNNLVKKLRGARPTIANQLWGTVLNSVSSYFTSIRGTTSVVTKTDDGFFVNGRPMAGLSGSTKDALGLAIRVALTKTFLPNSTFLVLDEIAAGMTDERETAMLGMVASCGMSQVILVTHSELADAFADNVITL